MAVVNEVMLMGEQATKNYMLTANYSDLKETPRMVTEKELTPEVQAAYVAGYHNGSLDVAIEALGVINTMNDNVAKAASELKVYEMPPTKKKHTGAKLMVLGLVVGVGAYLYEKHKDKKSKNYIDEYDDDFFEDDESERPEE